MGSLLSYSLCVSIVLIPLYVIYRTMLASTTLLSFNRAVLLTIYAVALLMPLLLWIAPMLADTGNGVAIEVGALVGGIIADDPVAGTSSWSWYRIALWVYSFGVAVFTCRVVVTLGGIAWLILRSDKCRIDGRIVVRHNRRGLVPFSWCRWIFIPADGCYSDSIVMVHEAAHLARRHWIDLLIAEAVLIIDWYNPVAWQMRDALQDIHEFQADDDVIAHGVDARTYQMFLIKKTVGNRFHALADSLNHSSLKKRITMMLSRKSRSSARLRAMALMPALALGAVVINLPVVASTVGTFGSTTLYVSEKSQSQQPKEAVAGKDTKNSDAVGQVFHTAEQMPQFPGGEKALMEYIGSHIQYPSEAKEVSGRVIVRFVVGKDGSVRDVTVVRGQHPALDKEAVRVVQSLPAFTPGSVEGKPVAVYYMLPISFKAYSGSATASATPAPASAKEKPVRAAEKMPEFPGGEKALYAFIMENIKCPEVGADAPDRLRAVVQFTVSATGRVEAPQIIKSTGYDQCDAEALRVVGILPDFTPGMTDGKPVAVGYTLPIHFAWKKSADIDNK